MTHRQHAVVAAIALAAAAAADRSVQPGVPMGWRNNRATLATVELKGEGDPIKVAYDLQRPTPVVELDGEPVARRAARGEPRVRGRSPSAACAGATAYT